jgi:hypothetical protein
LGFDHSIQMISRSLLGVTLFLSPSGRGCRRGGKEKYT